MKMSVHSCSYSKVERSCESKVVDIKDDLDKVNFINVFRIPEKNRKLATICISKGYLSQRETTNILEPFIDKPSEWAQQFYNLIQSSSRRIEWLNFLCDPNLTENRSYAKNLQEVFSSTQLFRPVVKFPTPTGPKYLQSLQKQVEKPWVRAILFALSIGMVITVIFLPKLIVPKIAHMKLLPIYSSNNYSSSNISNVEIITRYDTNNDKPKGNCFYEKPNCKILHGIQTAIIDRNFTCKLKCRPRLEGLQFKNIPVSIGEVAFTIALFQTKLKFLEFDGNLICNRNSDCLSRVGLLPQVLLTKLETLSFVNLDSRYLPRSCSALYYWLAHSSVENLTPRNLSFNNCTFTDESGEWVEQIIKKVAEGGKLKTLTLNNVHFETKIFTGRARCPNKINTVKFILNGPPSENNNFSALNFATSFLENCFIQRFEISYPLPFLLVKNAWKITQKLSNQYSQHLYDKRNETQLVIKVYVSGVYYLL